MTALDWLDEGPREAPAIVMLSGGGAGPRIYDAIVPALSRRHRVLRPTFPGYGRVPRQVPIDFATQDRVLLADLRVLGAERPVVLGYSMGGYRALRLAVAMPVARVFALGTWGAFPRALAAAHVPLIAALRANPAMLADLLPGMFAPAFRTAHPGRVAEVIARAAGGGLVAADENEHAATLPDITAAVAATGVPVHLRAGLLDESVPVDASRALAAGIPGATLDLVPGCGHALVEEEADAVVAWVEQHLGERP